MLQTAYFLGANSPAGFSSLYDELSDPNRMKALYILKGGPGCGKSTLMKRVARHAEAAGLDIQRILCSGDPESLDAVFFPQTGIAVADGTAPHVMEACCPGAVETYIDLSRFYDRSALQSVKQELLACSTEYKEHYRNAYRTLGAAGELRRSLSEAAESAELRQKLQKRAKGIIGRELKESSGGSGQAERRFLGAVTHRGAVQLWDTVSAQASRVYELEDTHGLAHHLLSPILQAALAAGCRAVACFDPMDPDRLAHLILPEHSLAFVTSPAEMPWPHHPYRRLRLDAMAEETLRRAGKPRLRFTRKITDALLEDSIASLSAAKAAHDRLEALYNPHVDFDGVLSLADQLATRILT